MRSKSRANVRLGLFIDGPFRVGESGRVFCGDELFGFMGFASEVGSHFAEFQIIARTAVDPAAATLELPASVGLLALPGYGNLRQLGRLARAFPATLPALWRAVGSVDVVWVSGVHPFGPLVAAMAMLRRRHPVLLIRQETLSYFRSRLPGRAWVSLMPVLWFLEQLHRLLGRRLRVTAVGPRIAKRYGGPASRVLEMRVTNLSESQLSGASTHNAQGRPVRLLCVGRLAAEKNPALAVKVLARLNEPEPGGYELSWVGEGPLSATTRAEADRLGIADRVHFPGFVSSAAELLECYLASDVLVHTSLTEGVPSVILEALAVGLPVVATDVGGVRSALGDGAAGLLVPPGDAGAIAAAVQRLIGDPDLRDRLVTRGRELTRDLTLESEAERVAGFLAP